MPRADKRKGLDAAPAATPAKKPKAGEKAKGGRPTNNQQLAKAAELDAAAATPVPGRCETIVPPSAMGHVGGSPVSDLWGPESEVLC